MTGLNINRFFKNFNKFDFNPKEGVELILNNKQPNTFLWDHLYPFYHPETLLEYFPKSKVIIFIRDPRDVLISALNFFPQTLPRWVKLNEYEFYSKGDCRQVCRDWLKLNTSDKIKALLLNDENEKVWGCDFQKFYALAKKWISYPNVYLCRFEDFLNPETRNTEMICLAQFLEIDLKASDCDEIYTKSFGGTCTFTNDKKVHKWEKYFENEIKRIVKEELGEYTIYFGYEKDNNW